MKDHYLISTGRRMVALVMLATASLLTRGDAADLATARATSEQSAVYLSVPMNASTTIYAGTIVCVDTDGYARNASLNTSGYVMIGVATQTKTNSGADGAAVIRVKRSLFKFTNSAANAVDQDDVGKLVYVEDNHTVADSTSNAVIAGVCVAKESDGVWVDIRALATNVGTPENDSVTSAKIAANTIVAADIATGAVETTEILDGTISADDIATSAVATAEILDGTITADDIATGAVATAEILDGTIGAGDIASDAVEAAEIAAGAVGSDELATNSVTTVKVTDANITPVKYNIVEARTVTADGTTTGTVSATTTHVTVTSDSADKILILPAPVVGRTIWIHTGATGFELRSTDPTTIAINGGTGANAESAIAANSTVLVICVSSTAWKAIYLDADSDVAKVEPAA